MEECPQGSHACLQPTKHQVCRSTLHAWFICRKEELCWQNLHSLPFFLQPPISAGHLKDHSANNPYITSGIVELKKVAFSTEVDGHQHILTRDWLEFYQRMQNACLCRMHAAAQIALLTTLMRACATPMGDARCMHCLHSDHRT